MAWIQPKVSWLPVDYFDLSDWDRVTGNFKYLYDLVGATFTIKDTELKDTNAIPFYDVVNNLEDNLQHLYDYLSYSFITFAETIWYPRKSSSYTHNPSYEDFNRWENLEQQISYWYNIDHNPQNVLRSGTFYAGTDRVTQSLSRGR